MIFREPLARFYSELHYREWLINYASGDWYYPDYPDAVLYWMWGWGKDYYDIYESFRNKSRSEVVRTFSTMQMPAHTRQIRYVIGLTGNPQITPQQVHDAISIIQSVDIVGLADSRNLWVQQLSNLAGQQVSARARQAMHVSANPGAWSMPPRDIVLRATELLWADRAIYSAAELIAHSRYSNLNSD